MAKNPTEDLLGLVRDVARMELAALNAGITYWSGWADSTAKFARATNHELINVSKGSAKISEVVSRIADSSREFLNRQVALPVEAAEEFKTGFKKVVEQPRTRSTKAKVRTRKSGA